ncbi:MAG: YjzC family protein [Sphaerochaetaceae bacterium]|jgi:hypothetical protein|nr:YjzC family protein [Sphaerochaetaceae bacterium]MDD3671726.1 YjzC family protein [Sphaerochaetaceae bacterium]MDD4260498.1 YjzC family protein [Sphaerochaetaceae bacterium]MDD4763346.1 YjzC family protein [Sphaerochaetaceae bacterium]MDD5076809.1 YjzC family protein [Sphaerochaetaceae bacterium]
MAIGDVFVTGMKSEHYAEYKWEAYTDGTKTPGPKDEEMRITLRIGESLPAILSTGKNAIWRMIAYIC